MNTTAHPGAARAFLDLLNAHPDLSLPLIQLTMFEFPDGMAREGHTTLGTLREVRVTGDAEQIDAALRAVIRQAQQARKALKS